MINPIIKNYQSKLRYAGVWILISAIQTLVLHLFTDIPTQYIILDSLIFNTLFAYLLILLWLPVRFARIPHFRLLYHLLMAVVVVLVCFTTGSLLMCLLTRNDPVYISFLKETISWRISGGFLLVIITILSYYLYLCTRKLNEKASNEIRLSQLVKNGEMNLLKSQINPHFLFNSLNSLNSLIVKSPEQAQEMLVALSDYLRYTVLSTQQDYFSLQGEIENIKHYLAIEELRFGDKLLYRFDIATDCLPLNVPSMLLQPLFENAVKHGVCESLQNVCIEVKARRDALYLWLSVNNDFDTDNTYQPKGSGTGLRNIKERLRLCYGENASLQTKIENGKFMVTLKIPLFYE